MSSFYLRTGGKGGKGGKVMHFFYQKNNYIKINCCVKIV